MLRFSRLQFQPFNSFNTAPVEMSYTFCKPNRCPNSVPGSALPELAAFIASQGRRAIRVTNVAY